jgi:DNA sulfur modification protein DndD
MSNQKDIEYAHKSRLVSRAYADALLRQRIGLIEERMVEGFNIINRKDNLLSKVTIDLSDYSIQISGYNGAVSDIESLSLGERQILAMATLWALRDISGRDLPLFIDTPLARLDGIHRSRLVSQYFREISEQVILFSTDSEIDDSLHEEMMEFISRSYRLAFDPKERETQVENSKLPLDFATKNIPIRPPNNGGCN